MNPRPRVQGRKERQPEEGHAEDLWNGLLKDLQPLASTAATDVQALFDRFNREFFDGQLPRYRVLVTRFTRRTNGETDNSHRRILIREGLKAPTLRKVLLHEMCHIGSEGHGRQFQANLTRLIRQGESWAVAERKHYRAVTRLIRQIPTLRRLARTGSPTERREALATLRLVALLHGHAGGRVAG